jgi:hypothetical protein
MKPRSYSRRALTAAFSFFLSLWIAQGLRAELGNDNPNGPAGDYNGSVTSAGYYDPFTGNAKRVIDDITVPGSVGAYPLKWGLGIWPQLPPQYEPGPEGSIGYPDGRSVDLYDAGGGSYLPMRRALDQVREYVLKTGGGDYGLGYYDLLLGDGGKVRFGPVPGVGLAPQAIVDPYGLTTTLSYLSGRLDKITEPGGRYLKIKLYHPHVDGQLGLCSHVLLNQQCRSL